MSIAYLKPVKNPIERLAPDDNVLKLNSTLHLLSTYKLKDCYLDHWTENIVNL
jgi:hypothetical protein